MLEQSIIVFISVDYPASKIWDLLPRNIKTNGLKIVFADHIKNLGPVFQGFELQLVLIMNQRKAILVSFPPERLGGINFLLQKGRRLWRTWFLYGMYFFRLRVGEVYLKFSGVLSSEVKCTSSFFLSFIHATSCQVIIHPKILIISWHYWFCQRMP